ncbi:hypothetical protein AAG570_009505 [Ranatra chinensis]|uniref:Uncharacterized protein n=1 Tax=Ranatra chinensis TaxID=642074 RepID=A0ABD0YRF2_9HEMI
MASKCPKHVLPEQEAGDDGNSHRSRAEESIVIVAEGIGEPRLRSHVDDKSEASQKWGGIISGRIDLYAARPGAQGMDFLPGFHSLALGVQNQIYRLDTREIPLKLSVLKSVNNLMS